MLNKFIAGALTLGKVASGEEYKCHDTESFDICLDRARNGECGLGTGCERTCEQCGNDDCYDKIPASHTILWNYSRVAYCPWPNTGGYGCSYPTYEPTDQNSGENDWFPWNKFTVSTFCKEVFINGQCEDTTLALTYSWFESVPDEWTGEMIEVEQVRKLDLHAPAKNFCRFSCGFCPSGANSAETDSDNKQCWKNYNDKMAIIYKEYSVDNLLGDFGNFEETFDSWGGNLGSDMSGGDDWNWGWRKRRDSGLDLPKNELLAEAVESMVFPQLKDSLPLNARVRRGGWGSMGFDPSFFDQGFFEEESSQEEGPLGAQEYIGNNQCFPFMANDAGLNSDEQNEGEPQCEEGQEYDEEEGACVGGGEEREDPGDRVRSMRRDTDHDGINAWLKDYSTNGISLDGEYCDDVINIFEEEYLQGMLLEYSCHLSCPEGSDPWYIYSDETKEKHLKVKLKLLGRDEFSDEEKEKYALKDVLLNGEDSLKMECRKPHYQKLHKPSDCKATEYCGETSCQGGEVTCVENAEPEVYEYPEESEEPIYSEESEEPNYIIESESAERPEYSEYEEEEY